MYIENITITASYYENALSKSVNSLSLCVIVFLSYCKPSHCYVSNKSILFCLITMSFLSRLDS